MSFSQTLQSVSKTPSIPRLPRLAILIPVFNEGRIVEQVLENLIRATCDINAQIIVVNDGSNDQTGEILKTFGEQIIVLEHLINAGLGTAITTGFDYVRQHGFDYMITFDADGQHRHEDLKTVYLELLESDADVVIGSRLKDARGMPWYRQIGNWGLNIFTYLFFGVWTTDSQSGLRGFNRRAIETIELESTRMEVSSEIFDQIKRQKLKFSEVPIKAIYTDYSLEKGQSNLNGIKILFKLLMSKLFK